MLELQNSNLRKISFFGREIEMDMSHSIEEIKEALTTMFPQLDNAVPEMDEQGNVKFVVLAGTKG